MREGIIRRSGKPGERKEHLRAVADPPPDAKAVRELRWFFQEAESAVDVASNFGGFADGSRLDEELERRADALHAAEKIDGWLKALPADHLAVLVALFRPGVVPEALAERIAAEGAKAEAAARSEAERMRAGALRAYERVRGPGPCVAPEEE